MAKLEYTFSSEDLKVLDKIRLSGDPSLVVTTLKLGETVAEIKEQFQKNQVTQDYGTTYELLRKLLNSKEHYEHSPCIVVVDHAAKNKHSGETNSKVVIIKWIPEGSHPKQKMVYSSAWQPIKDLMAGKCHIATNNMFECADWDDVEDKLKCA